MLYTYGVPIWFVAVVVLETFNSYGVDEGVPEQIRSRLGMMPNTSSGGLPPDVEHLRCSDLVWVVVLETFNSYGVDDAIRTSCQFRASF